MVCDPTSSELFGQLGSICCQLSLLSGLPRLYVLYDDLNDSDREMFWLFIHIIYTLRHIMPTRGVITYYSHDNVRQYND